MVILRIQLALRHCVIVWELADKLKAIMSNGLTFITYSIEMGQLMLDCSILHNADTRPYIFGFSNIEEKKEPL